MMDASLINTIVVIVTVCLQNVMSEEESILETVTSRLTSGTSDQRLDRWHSDCFSICDQRMGQAIRTACQHDPYRISRRSVTASKRNTADQSIMSAIAPTVTQPKDSTFFLTKRLASQFLHHGSSKQAVLKRKKRNIISECCYNVCAWEEYAEYCHGHPRTAPRRTSYCV